MERYLQLCAENNLQVCNATTPAQYFHLLRRQMHGGKDRRGMRKPLIIFTPKSLLRHPKVVSAVEEFTSGGFQEVIGETTVIPPDRVGRILLCSGKVYYDLVAAREQRDNPPVPVVRLEQLYPFPAARIQDVLARYPVTSEVVWVQDEPRNMGAWRHVEEQMRELLEPTRRTLRYVGRATSASPSAGSLKRHQQEQAELLDEAFAEGMLPRRKVRLVARRRTD
jgi:2-oxoglutarate dehydrogenase E1 component